MLKALSLKHKAFEEKIMDTNFVVGTIGLLIASSMFMYVFKIIIDSVNQMNGDCK